MGWGEEEHGGPHIGKAGYRIRGRVLESLLRWRRDVSGV